MATRKTEKTAPTNDQTLQDELNNRAEAFAKQFANATYEMGQAQNFIRELCGVYGLNYLRSVDFERRIQKSSGRGINRIDGFFPGQLLIEMKSAGQDLAEAYEQAKGYLPLLKNAAEMPRYILVSDFQNLHLYDLHAKPEQEPLRFPLAHFRQHVNALDFLLGYERVYQELQERITQQAATALGALHDAVKKDRYPQADLQTLLVRILFCLFAEDTDIFGEGESFKKLIASTPSDGRGLGATLGQLFLRPATSGPTRAKPCSNAARPTGPKSAPTSLAACSSTSCTGRTKPPAAKAKSATSLGRTTPPSATSCAASARCFWTTCKTP